MKEKEEERKKGLPSQIQDWQLNNNEGRHRGRQRQSQGMKKPLSLTLLCPTTHNTNIWILMYNQSDISRGGGNCVFVTQH